MCIRDSANTFQKCCLQIRKKTNETNDTGRRCFHYGWWRYKFSEQYNHRTWAVVFQCNPQTKQQLSKWKSKSSWTQYKSKGIVMLAFFLQSHYESTMNSFHKAKWWMRKCTVIYKKQSEVSVLKNWEKLGSFAQQCASASVNPGRVLAHHNMTALESPPYPPDLVTAAFYLFPPMKLTLKSKKYKDADNVIVGSPKWQSSCRRFLRMGSLSVSKNFTYIGRNVWSPKGTILKQIQYKTF